jgi:hypothetical protein
MTESSSATALSAPKNRGGIQNSLAAAFAFPIWIGVLIGAASGHWWFFGQGSVAYGDLNWIATWSECLRSAGPLNAIDVCEIAYPLPSVWVGATLGLTPDHVAVVGDVLAIAWAMAATALIWFAVRVGSAFWGLLVAIILCSPPTWLLLQRGNLDIIVWILVMMALLLAWNQRKVSASLVTACAVLLKIFPLGMTLSVLPELWSNWRRALVLGAAPIISGLAVVAGGRYVSDLRPSPVGDAFAAFHSVYLGRVGLLIAQGESVEPTSITVQVLPTALDYILGAVVFLSASILIWLLIVRRSRLVVAPQAAPWFLSALGLILFSYLTGANFDYRLTFLAFVVVGIAVTAGGATGKQQRWLLALGSGFSAATWLSVSNPLPVQILGDGLLWVFLAIGTAIAAQAIVQAKAVREPGTGEQTTLQSANGVEPHQP